MRYLIEIERRAGNYEAMVYKGRRDLATHLPSLALAPNALINSQDKQFSLAQVVNSLIDFHPDQARNTFNERWQLDVGQYLYNQIFKAIPDFRDASLRQQGVEVRILSDDEHITRLPWQLLCDNGIFLSAAGWSVGFADSVSSGDCELPPSPRVLICAPQPREMEDTRAQHHLEEIREMLSSADRLLELNRNLRIVTSKDEFVTSLLSFLPHVVYYYGHGVGDANGSSLAFATGSKNQRIDVPIADLANIFRAKEHRPLLVYLNCCLGDAGGLLGAGRQLRTVIPAVLTNYTIAHIDAAQAQGMAVLQSVLLDGLPPHLAVSRMRSSTGRMNLSFKDLRWMTPVIHYQYDQWQANPPKPANRLERDGHWSFKVDRVRQFGQVVYQTTQMLRERQPKSRAYIWYGAPGQGVDKFHRRLNVELQEQIGNTHLYEVKAEWPVEFSRPHKSWENMLLEAFDVQAFDDIPGRIRTQTRGAAGRNTLVYMRHQPVHSSEVINPSVIKGYLEWWAYNFVPLLENSVFALLGISFVPGKPRNFRNSLEAEGIDALHLDGCAIQILDEMEHLSKKDLMDFLQSHNIQLPPSRRSQILDKILEDTQGSYDITLDALRDVVDRAWAIEETNMRPDNPVKKFDYD